MLNVFLQGLGINNDVIEIYVHPLPNVPTEEVIHQGLVRSRCVTVTDLNNGAKHVFHWMLLLQTDQHVQTLYGFSHKHPAHQ